MRRGEVRWYRFKAPDKQRPVVLLTRDAALEYLGEVAVAVTRSKPPGLLRSRRIPRWARLSPSRIRSESLLEPHLSDNRLTSVLQSPATAKG